MSPDPLVSLRCSTIVFRDGAVLVVHRGERGDVVLPGGNPRAHEGALACARREVREETGLEVDPGRCAFVLDTIDPGAERRIIEIVFLSPDRPAGTPVCVEAGLEPEFVALDRLGELSMRPPLAGHIRGLSGRRYPATAPYLGNLWRPPVGWSNGG
jgi:8-oxo-dGTP pyrophosphatase MutT (NUDIX family)